MFAEFVATTVRLLKPMGGRDATRGFLVQALIAILRSLEDADWDAISIEPDDESEKIDIAWDFGNSRRRVQVKSTLNRFTKSAIETVANQIHVFTPVDTVELILVGSVACDIARCSVPKNIKILPPKNNDIAGLKNEAAFLVGSYAALHNRSQPSPQASLLIADGLTSLILKLGTEGKRFTRADFETNLATWFEQLTKCSESDLISEATDETFLQRRSRNQFFSGRSKELAEIACLLDSYGHICIIGLGGVGKTQLAVEYAYSRLDKYSAIIWIDAADEETIGESVSRWTTAIRLTSSQTSPQAAVTAMRKWLKANDAWLIIIDNVEDRESVARLVPDSSSGKVLATTRRAEVADFLPAKINLSCLDDGAAVSFLMKRTSRLTSSSLEVEAATSIARELGGLFLALEQASAYLLSKGTSFRAYLSSFRAKRLELLERNAPRAGNYEKSVATTWLLNVAEVQKQSMASYKALEVISFLAPEYIPQEFFAIASSQLPREIGDHLKDFFPSEDESLLDELFAPLTQLSLLERDGDLKTVSVHRLVQDVTRANINKEAAKALWRQILEAMSTAFPSVEPLSANNCGRLMRHAIKIVSESDEADLQSENSASLLHRLAQFAEYQGAYGLAVSINRSAAAIKKKMFGPEHRELGVTMNNLGVAIEKSGFPSQAVPIFREALRIRERALGGCHSEVAQTKQNLANALSAVGNHQEAYQLLIAARDSYKENCDDLEGLSYCFGNLALVCQLLDEDEQRAEQFMRECLKIRTAFPNWDQNPAIATTLGNIAIFEANRGDFSSAADHIEQAKQIILRTVGPFHPDYGMCLHAEGVVRRAAGDRDEAIKVYKRCIALLVHTLGVGHPKIAESQSNLAGCYLEANRYEEAAVLLQSALAQAVERVGENGSSVATLANNLAYTYLVTGRYDDSIFLYHKAKRIRVISKGWDCNDVAVSLANIAICYWRLDLPKISLQYFNQAYEIYAKLAFPAIQDCRRFLSHFTSFLLNQNMEPDARAVARRLRKLNI